MTEAQIGFLYKIAAALPKSQCDGYTNLLKSYYLMHCVDKTRGYGLPDKHFSTKIRCPHCCIEWKRNTKVKVKTIKLSKRQKQRLKSKKITQNRKESVRSRNNLLKSNELEQICSFCYKSTVTTVLKPQKQRLACTLKSKQVDTVTDDITINTKQDNKNLNSGSKKKLETNVYANALDIFSLQNKNNTLASTIKEKTKPINNNKRKKDKFAGLCQKAVLASAKLKHLNKKSNSLNMFLKPSSS